MEVLPRLLPPLTTLSVYTTKGNIFVVGFDRSSSSYKILVVDRPAMAAPESLVIVQDTLEYSRSQLEAKIKFLADSYSTMEKVAENAVCIFGFIKLLDSYYLILVTKKVKVASVHGHYIYSIADTQMVQVTFKPRQNAEESRYKSLLQITDLTKEFYFSFTYDLSNTMQNNFVNVSDYRSGHKVVRDMFVWNSFALKPLTGVIEGIATREENPWVVPIIHGFVMQRSFRLAGGQLMKVTLIARRSRMFAGTRYLRRGVNSDGWVNSVRLLHRHVEL
jgi:hypothetical protein